MPTRIVTARAPKRRKPTNAGAKITSAIVGKLAPEPETPKAYKARGDVTERQGGSCRRRSALRRNDPVSASGKPGAGTTRRKLNPLSCFYLN